jgi:hypothetical protein
VVKAAIASSVAAVVPEGKVEFYLDGKRLSTVVLDADDKGLVQLKLPKLGRTGTRTIEVRYLGSSKLVASSQTVTVTVVT